MRIALLASAMVVTAILPLGLGMGATDLEPADRGAAIQPGSLPLPAADHPTPWVGYTGDFMTGDLDMGTNAIVFLRPLADVGAGLQYGGIDVCLDAGSSGAFCGPPGPKGDKGDPGVQGIAGPKGDKGDKGDRGDPGLQGPKGDRGDKGDRGEHGVQGEPGDRSEQGLKGDKGDPGEQGLQGDRGDQGPKGDKGDRGEQGLKGDKGDRGEQGLKGDKGDRGDAGPPGDDGVSGWERVLGTRVNVARNANVQLEVHCPGSKKVMGGGAWTSLYSIHLVTSFPLDDNTWRVNVDNTSGNTDGEARPYVICAWT